jgi:predicted site-specific integrase-resolvase
MGEGRQDYGHSYWARGPYSHHRSGAAAEVIVLYGRVSGHEQKEDLQRQVAEVVVTCSDRLTRFGPSYLQALFSGYGVTLTMLHSDEEQTPEAEVTQDLLAFLASFAGRLYGLRSRKQRALVDCVKQVLAEQEL